VYYTRVTSQVEKDSNTKQSYSGQELRIPTLSFVLNLATFSGAKRVIFRGHVVYTVIRPPGNPIKNEPDGFHYTICSV